MPCLHEYILHTIKPTYLKKFGGTDTPSQDIPDSDIFNDMFVNYRKTKDKHFGLRLSYVGEVIMKAHFSEYKYLIQNTPSNQALIVLDKKMEWPYYVGKKYVAFFNEIDASWFSLTGHDLAKFTEDL